MSFRYSRSDMSSACPSVRTGPGAWTWLIRPGEHEVQSEAAGHLAGPFAELSKLLGGPAVRLRAALPEELFAGGTLRGSLGRSVGLSAAEVMQTLKEMKRKMQQEKHQRPAKEGVGHGKHLLHSSAPSAKRRISVTAGSVAGTRRLSTPALRRIVQAALSRDGGDKGPETEAAATGERERRESTAQQRRVSVGGGHQRGQAPTHYSTAPRRLSSAGMPDSSRDVRMPTQTRTGPRRVSYAPKGDPAPSRGTPIRRMSAPRFRARDSTFADNGTLARATAPRRVVAYTAGVTDAGARPPQAGGTAVATPPRSAAVKLDHSVGLSPQRAGTPSRTASSVAGGACGPPAIAPASGAEFKAYDSKVAAVAHAAALAPSAEQATGFASQFARISGGRLQARVSASRKSSKYSPSSEAVFPFSRSVTLPPPKAARLALRPSSELNNAPQDLRLPPRAVGTPSQAAAVSADEVAVSVIDGAPSPSVAAVPALTARGQSASAAGRLSFSALPGAADPPRRPSIDDNQRQHCGAGALQDPAPAADTAATAVAVAGDEERKLASQAHVIRRVSAAQPVRGLARTSTAPRERRPSVSAAAAMLTPGRASAVFFGESVHKSVDTAPMRLNEEGEERLAVTAFVVALMYVTRVKPGEQARSQRPATPL